jgi:hypothetical protein
MGHPAPRKFIPDISQPRASWYDVRAQSSLTRAEFMTPAIIAIQRCAPHRNFRHHRSDVGITAPASNAQAFNTTFSDCASPVPTRHSPPICAGMSNNRPTPAVLSVGDFWNQSVSGSGLSSIASINL